MTAPVEIVIALALLLAATLPLALTLTRTTTSTRRALTFTAWTCILATITYLSLTYSPRAAAQSQPTDRPLEETHSGYVSSSACQSCHPGEYASWHRSYHRSMTQRATTQTVLGPVDGTIVWTRGRPFRLESRGEEVWVEMDDTDWMGEAGKAPRVSRQIVMTTGSHNEQFYWVSSGSTRELTILPIMYRLLDEQRWESLDGCCISMPGEVQETIKGRWNRVCNRCHATQTQPRIDVAANTVDTRSAEFGIACEACHGPGGEHAQTYRDPLRRYASHFAGDEAADGSGRGAAHIVNPARLSKERSAEVCGQCHSINHFHDDADRDEWRQTGYRYRPGDVLAESKKFKEQGDDHFWSDGMVRVGGREYHGLVRSPCYVNGEMTCLSCHSMHAEGGHGSAQKLDAWATDQLKQGLDGDRACTQCHAQYTEPAAIAAHTHHKVGSTGSSCMNCHMPYTTYGLLKGIRSHQVSSPSVQASVDTGRPNACNQCHLDRPLQWADDQLQRWYGAQPATLNEDQRTLAAGVMWTLLGDAGQRALMAWSMGWEPARAASGIDWMTPYLALLLRDRYGAVRMIAHRSIQQQPEGVRLANYQPMGAQEGWMRATDPVYVAWTARRMAQTPHLLIAADSGLDMGRLNALLARRHDPPMALNE